MQFVKDYHYLPIKCDKLKNEDEMRKWNQKIFDIPFHLINSPLYSLTMFELEDGRGGFNATFHHMISDAWSMSLLISQVMNFYSQIISKQNEKIQMPTYLDYIYSEQEYLASTKFQKDKEYWDSVFDSAPELSVLAKKESASLSTDTKACRKSYIFSQDLYNQINELCNNLHCSIYTFLMSIYSIYLSKLNNSNYSIIGTPVLNRTNFKEKHTSGMFISTVPFKIEVISDLSFEEFLKNVAKTQMATFRHQKYPYSNLLEDLKKKYNFTENLYDIALSYQNARDNRENCSVNYSSEWLFSGNVSDTLQIHFYDMDNTGTLDIFYDYQTAKLTEKNIEELHSRILYMMEQVVKNPTSSISEIKMITEDEQNIFLHRYDNNLLPYPKEESIIDLWEKQVNLHPEATAILDKNTKLTYQELENKVDALATYLQECGVKKGDVIPTFLERSPELIISLLAIMKCGGIYLPVSTFLPADRIDYILKDSQTKYCITTSRNMQNVKLEVSNIILLDKIELMTSRVKQVPTAPSDVIYTIYTSGSTGNPKGVQVTNQNLNNFIHSFQEYFNHQISCKDVCLASTNISFDVSIWEFFFCLLNGAALYLYDEDTISDIFHYCEAITQNHITMLYLPPNILENVYAILSEKKQEVFIDKILVGVEPIRNSTIQKFFNLNNNMQIVNGYGPTETTICCTAHVVHKNEKLAAPIIPIGKPFYNLKAYVVNKDLNLVPEGVAGELLIGGDNVSKGYLNREDLTLEKYITSPFATDERLYRTGDIVKFLPDGDLIFVGRNDKQVKLRGHRIEIGGIESTILDYSGITKCKILLKNENTIMVAFFTANSKIDINNLKDYLSKKVPLYAIPNFFVQLEAFPLTSNGKIDKEKLSKIEVKIDSTYVEPNTKLEKELVDLWETLLATSPIGIQDNFFYIGGDSLACIKLISEIYAKFNIKLAVKDIFDYPTIKKLAAHMEKAKSKELSSTIMPAAKANSYPLSGAQKRIYFVANQDPNSLLYNIAGGISFNAVPDTNKLENCLNDLIRKHSSLRTYFTVENGDVVQKIEEKIDFHLEVEKQKAKSNQDLFTEFIKPFDMTKPPLFRAKLVILDDNSCLLLLDMHHIISDGASVEIFVKELCNSYNGIVTPKEKIDYKDFAVWEQEQKNSETYKESKKFWVSQFQDSLPVLTMPTTYARPAKQSFEGDNYTFNLDTKMYDQIVKFANDKNLTPYMVLLSAYFILLSKYSSQEDIIVGTPVVGREKEELSSMIGMFVNSLPLRTTIDKNATFIEFCSNLKEYCLSCFEHQDYPFNELISDLALKRDISRNPLFDTMFIYQNNGYPDFYLDDVKGVYHTPNLNISKFDLSLEVIPSDNEFNIRIEYCTKLFDLAFVKDFANHYQTILNNLLDNSNACIGNINMISKEEENQILKEFNNTATRYPREKNIITLWEEQVKLTPDKKAIIFEDTSMTYQELEEKSNALAHFLLKNGAHEKEVIPILLDKSLEMIVGILAILKVGAAFLPIDVYYPKERIDYILRDANSKLLITNNDFIHKANSVVKALSIELSNVLYNTNSVEQIAQNYSPDSLAYIMYTSGSTGKPKGVMITHQNIVRLVKNNKFIEFQKEEHILQTGSIVFDACTFEIWASLLNGFELYIMKKQELLDASLLQDYLIKNKITILWLTAPLFNQLCEDNPHMFRTVRVLLTGGDVLSPRHINLVKTANPNLTVINGYGPTENTTFSCCFTIDKKYTTSIPIGKPISNSTAYIVSDTGSLQPIGMPGELWVGGDGVGKGYLNNPELTSQKFIPNPFGSGMIYKTGDLVKWRKDGTIDFLGRIDHQVKIRGFRVELGEINLHICNFPGINEATTLVNTIQGEKVICTYFVSDRNISINDLKNHLSKFLPNYMIPTYFMRLKKFPINTNGKIDRNALPTNFEKVISHKTDIVLPSNKTEELISNMFKKVLNIEEVSVTDSFFEIGGDSLTAMKLQVEALSNNLTISYGDIFEYTTVRELANHLKKQDASSSSEEMKNQYAKYDDIISKNHISADIDVSYTPINNVLLTGFTGFLGAHVLDSYIKHEKGTIYCLIRGKNNMSAEERLKNVLHFYFDENYDKYIGNRIQLVEGDITLPQFGLSNEEYKKLGNKLDTVIHCAALVKHFGNYEDFKSINIDGTQKMVDFCKEFHLKLLHVSTISVSGNNLAEGANIENNFKEAVDFNETNFYIGQNLKNAYVHSKFEAERIVLDAISHGLEACILRMGNLTSRFSEGKFQQNHFENAFVNRIKSFLQIGYMPDYMLNLYAEFTPIDYCGDAIIKIASHFNKNYTIFHLLNEKHVNLDVMYETMTNLGIDMKIVSSKDFTKILNDLLQDPDKKNYLNGIVNDLNQDKKLVYQSDVTIKSDFTKEFLNKIGFDWPAIDKRYLRNYFKYLADIGYFNIDIN